MTKAGESYSYQSFQKKYHVSPSGYSINATQDYELNTMSLQFDGAYNQPTDAIFSLRIKSTRDSPPMKTHRSLVPPRLVSGQENLLN